MSAAAEGGSVSEPVRPGYYGGPDNAYETIKVIRAWGLNFELGNVAKYLSRAGKKQGADAVDDLRKLITYAQMEIERTTRRVDCSSTSGGGQNEAGRIARLQAAAARLAAIGVDGVVSLHDHKGELTVCWTATPTAANRDAVGVVWRLLGEDQSNVLHEVAPRPLCGAS